MRCGQLRPVAKETDGWIDCKFAKINEIFSKGTGPKNYSEIRNPKVAGPNITAGV